MISNKRGIQCEDMVCAFLEGKGYSILARNFHCLGGEIDIIATLGKTIAFVEVKSFPPSWPLDDIALKVPASKQFKIKKTASAFLETDCHIKYDEIRFDVASVCGSEISFFEGAF